MSVGLHLHRCGHISLEKWKWGLHVGAFNGHQDLSCRTMTKLYVSIMMLEEKPGDSSVPNSMPSDSYFSILATMAPFVKPLTTMLHPIKSAASPVTLHANIFLPYSLKIWNLCHCRAVVSPTSLRFCLCVCARVCLITGVVSAVWESGHQLQAIIVTVLLCFKYLVPTSALRACRFCSFVFC